MKKTVNLHRMNAEVKAKWTKALRSGEYKQGKKRLRTENNEFCCLGVLCDLHAKEENHEWEQRSNFPYYLNEGGTLPIAVMLWADLATHEVFLPGQRISLVNLNDDQGRSFNEIADIIEEKL